MRILALIIVFTLSFNDLFGQRKSTKLDFSIIVADCFDFDTLDISLNGVNLIENNVVKSDFSTGLTGLGIYQDDTGLWVRNKQSKQKFDRLDLTQTLNLQIVTNGKLTDLSIKLKKGKILVMDFCSGVTNDGESMRMIVIQQHRKKVVFE